MHLMARILCECVFHVLKLAEIIVVAWLMSTFLFLSLSLFHCFCHLYDSWLSFFFLSPFVLVKIVLWFGRKFDIRHT